MVKCVCVCVCALEELALARVVTIGQCCESLSIGVRGDNLFVGHYPGCGIVNLCGEGTE